MTKVGTTTTKNGMKASIGSRAAASTFFTMLSMTLVASSPQASMLLLTIAVVFKGNTKVFNDEFTIGEQ